MIERLSQFIQSCKERWDQPGLSACIVTKDDVIISEGYGALTLDRPSPVSPKSVFALASCSKSFGAATAALLVDAGKLSWDDRVIDHLPHFELLDPYVTREVRIRDLLCNRLGITSSEGRHRALCRNRKDLVRKLKYHPFRHSFRSEYGYCTDAFSLIGEIVSEVAGEDWADFAERELWLPLGMRSTTASWRTTNDISALALPHIWRNDAFTTVPLTYEDHVATPAGGVNASCEDMARWLTFWLARPSGGFKDIMSQESYQEILKPHTPERGPFADHEFSGVAPLAHKKRYKHEAYALGWYVQEYADHTMYHHVGSIEGFRSAMAFSHELDLGVAVLANADNQFLPRAIVQGVFDHALKLDPAPWVDSCLAHDLKRRIADAKEAPTAQSPNLNDPKNYEGEYTDDGRFGQVRIFIENEILQMLIGDTLFRLTPCDQDTFLVYPNDHPYRRHLMKIKFFPSAGHSEGFDTDCDARFNRSQTAMAK